MDLSNCVRDEGLKSYFFVGDILKDCHGICPKGGVIIKRTRVDITVAWSSKRGTDHCFKGVLRVFPMKNVQSTLPRSSTNLR